MLAQTAVHTGASPSQNRAPSPTAAAPKTSDGKTDLSGVWRAATDTYQKNLAEGAQVDLRPGAAAAFTQRRQSAKKADPASRCLPRGIPAAMLVREYPWKLVQTPGAIVILFDEMLHFRQIHTDGRGLPDTVAPTWLGYSIGKWEGDVLVAETIGLTDETWLDEIGHPHAKPMRVIERFQRRTAGTMDIAITIDDAEAYTKPWTVTVRFERVPDDDFVEHLCALG